MRHPSASKISRPRISGILERPRLFKLLDRGRKKSVIWISGPAGSGKTTLTASWLDARRLPCLWYHVDEGDTDIASFFYYMGLAGKRAAPRHKRALPLFTPEYLGGLPVFTTRYFEELCGRVKPPFVLVFDNYQDVPAESQFHETLAHGLSVLPEGVTSIIMSRGEPPACFARLRANDALSFLGPDEIRFTLAESKEAVRRKGTKDLTEEVLVEIHTRTQGWAAGLALISEAVRKKRISPQFSAGDAPREIFHYFAGEILDKLDSETRDFLLLTSFLPKMTVQAAAHLSSYDNAGRILSRLTENNFFTEKNSLTDPVYQYHPLFREFLQERIKAALSREGVVRLQKQAAELLENSGQIEDAANLFREALDWERLARLALTHAPSLAAQGRNKTLKEWLTGIPEEILERNPLLLYWLGVCRLPYDLQESRGHFERAYSLFKEQRDPTGLYLSWSGVVDTYILERNSFVAMDRWILEIEELLREHPSFPSPAIKVRVTAMICFAMMYRQPNHPDFRVWEGRLLAVLPEIDDIGLRTILSSHLVFYYSWWSGELAKAELLIGNLRPSLSRLSEVHPFASIIFRSNEAAHFMVTGKSDLSQAAVEDALRMAAAAGIRVMDFMLCLFGAHNALCERNFEKARGFLDRAGSLENNVGHVELSHYHFQLAWESLCLGNPNLALEHAKTAVTLCIEAGALFLEAASRTGLAEVLLELDRPEEALKVLDEARTIGYSCNSKTLEFTALLIQTRIFLSTGKVDSASESMRAHLRTGRECGIYGAPWWRPEVMAGIYSWALEKGIETEYVREVIRRYRLAPEAPSVRVEQWPWHVKIYALGRFDLYVDEKPLRFEGKVQKKPLELLKALIALKGESSQDQISDLLWPDADGDAARNSFKMAVSRLRRLLDSDDALIVQEGKAVLDPRFVWVDAWTFEKCASGLEEELRISNSGPLTEDHKLQKNKSAVRRPQSEINLVSIEKAIALYKGHFLPDDAGQPWTVTLRERLRSKYLQIVTAAGDFLKALGRYEQCLVFYQKALDADHLAEAFYQNLMICHHKLGQSAEAVMTYERCQKALHTLGIDPSARTREILDAITRIRP